MIITCHWESNEQLLEALSPTGGAKPKQPSRISHNVKPREQEKETEAAVKLHRHWMKGFTGSKPRVAEKDNSTCCRERTSIKKPHTGE